MIALCADLDCFDFDFSLHLWKSANNIPEPKIDLNN